MGRQAGNSWGSQPAECHAGAGAEGKAGIREQWQNSKQGKGKHSSPGPPASQEGLPGPGFLGLHPGGGQDLGEQVALRKVKKAKSDNSSVS